MRNYNPEFLKLVKCVGENVYNIRTKKGLTIKELSEKTGIRKEYLKKIEKGEAVGIMTGQIFRLAIGLDVRPYELVTYLKH